MRTLINVDSCPFIAARSTRRAAPAIWSALNAGLSGATRWTTSLNRRSFSSRSSRLVIAGVNIPERAAFRFRFVTERLKSKSYIGIAASPVARVGPGTIPESYSGSGVGGGDYAGRCAAAPRASSSASAVDERAERLALHEAHQHAFAADVVDAQRDLVVAAQC